MPVTATHLTTDRLNASQSSYTTASITVPAGELILVAVNSDVNAVKPTVSGLSATFTEVVSASGGTNNMMVTLFRSLNLSAKSGTLSINFSSTSNLSSCGWSVSRYANIEQTGTNGANAIVQSATGSGNGVNNLTVTLGAFSNSSNATYGSVTLNGNGTITPGSGFTELGEDNDTRSIQSQWRNNNDTTVNWTFSSTFVVAGVAAEIKYSAVDLTKLGGSPMFFGGGVTIG